MSLWDTYQERIDVRGGTKRQSALKHESLAIKYKIRDNLSYTHVTIDEHPQDVAIINSDNLDEKTIISMPGEDIIHGGLVYWMDNYWIVTERDANTTVYTKGKMVQCNHLLKWVDENDKIIEQWCVIEDGTKYMSGEAEDRNFVTTRGDSRISITVPRNENTVKLNRENRFLVDDDDSPHKLAYILSKPLKSGNTYNGRGVFIFVCQEVTATEDDNHELGIADYYKHFPKESDETEDTDDSSVDSGTDSNGNKRWL